MLNTKYHFVINGKLITTIESLSEFSGIARSTISNNIIKNKKGKELSKYFDMRVQGINIRVILLNNKKF